MNTQLSVSFCAVTTDCSRPNWFGHWRWCTFLASRNQCRNSLNTKLADVVARKTFCPKRKLLNLTRLIDNRVEAVFDWSYSIDLCCWWEHFVSCCWLNALVWRVTKHRNKDHSSLQCVTVNVNWVEVIILDGSCNCSATFGFILHQTSIFYQKASCKVPKWMLCFLWNKFYVLHSILISNKLYVLFYGIVLL